MKRTLEPWYHKRTASAEQGVIIDEKSGASIAVVYDHAAHSRLIAKAPEMYEALRNVVDCMEAYCSDNVVMRKRSALHFSLESMLQDIDGQ